jgi:hypothetical protein
LTERLVTLGIGETIRKRTFDYLEDSSKRVTGLEIYDLGAGDNQVVLPKLETIRAFPRDVK